MTFFQLFNENKLIIKLIFGFKLIWFWCLALNWEMKNYSLGFERRFIVWQLKACAICIACKLRKLTVLTNEMLTPTLSQSTDHFLRYAQRFICSTFVFENSFNFLLVPVGDEFRFRRHSFFGGQDCLIWLCHIRMGHVMTAIAPFYEMVQICHQWEVAFVQVK